MGSSTHEPAGRAVVVFLLRGEGVGYGDGLGELVDVGFGAHFCVLGLGMRWRARGVGSIVRLEEFKVKSSCDGANGTFTWIVEPRSRIRPF